MRIKLPPAVLAVLVLAVGGCAVGPNYRPPVSHFDSGFATATTQPSSIVDGSVIGARWWRTLGDASLDGLMERAAASNLDVRAAGARVAQARAELAFANGGQLPTVNALANYSHNRLSRTAAPYNAFDVPGFPFDYNQYQAGFDASWELDVFGGVRRGVEGAQAASEASIANRENVLVTVMAEVARNYVDLRGDQRRLEIAEGNLRTQQETLEVTRDRRKQGVVTELDVAQAASQVAKTQATLPVLNRFASQAMHRIAVLLGQQPEALTAELAPHRPVPVPPAQIAVGLPAELLRRRPDIVAAERRLASATALIGVATADLYPRFQLVGSFTATSSDTADLFDFKSRSFGIGPSVSFPLFDAGRLRRLVDVRNAQADAALADYDRTVLGALEEAHDAIVTFVTEQQRHAALVDAVTADQTAADVSAAQYKQGLVDFLNVLDAQRSLFDSEDALADSDRAVTTALVALYKAIGGGWSLDERAAPPLANRPSTRPSDLPAESGSEQAALDAH